ncbi:MAG: hypothetical protein VX777_03405 [Chlamydiota bacterium]|nr:hypothetical protein [Chlamydiota bacterium]
MFFTKEEQSSHHDGILKHFTEGMQWIIEVVFFGINWTFLVTGRKETTCGY